jgi:hypothetical protein
MQTEAGMIGSLQTETWNRSWRLSGSKQHKMKFIFLQYSEATYQFCTEWLNIYILIHHPVTL